jgi:hypothetical protein
MVVGNAADATQGASAECKNYLINLPAFCCTMIGHKSHGPLGFVLRVSET